MKAPPIKIRQTIGTTCQDHAVSVIEGQDRVQGQTFAVAITVEAGAVLENDQIVRETYPQASGISPRKRYWGLLRHTWHDDSLPLSRVAPQTVAFETREKRSLQVLSETPVLDC